MPNLKLSFLAAGLAVLAAPFAATAQEPLPLENWAIREVIQQVQVSPDGSKMALMRNDSRDGNPIVEIYNTDDLSETPTRFDTKPTEVTSLFWANDDYLVFNTRQKVRNRIDGFNQGVYDGLSATYNLDTKKFTEFEEGTTIANRLPDQPNKLILGRPRSNSTLGEDDPFAFLRPYAYYEVDLERGTSSLIIKGNEDRGTVGFDDAGNPRTTASYEIETDDIIYYHRKPGESGWTEVRRQNAETFETFQFVGYPDDDPSTAYVLANNGEDLIGLYTYDLDNKQFKELLFRDDEADVAGVLNHSNYWGRGTEVIGAVYYGPKFERVYFNTESAQEEAALNEQLMSVIPNAHQLNINSRSRDGQVLTVYNTGPKDPGSYYLIKDGGLQYIGGTNPLVKAEDLSRVEYIKYPARDGRTIPGYVTIPDGEGPFPLIVLPHGGPHVAEVVNYDEWGQMLANHGYMVLYPQYRGSLGYGIDHFLATWNEHGKKMQDDKDDGALYLVDQGVDGVKADPDRLAMFGWSYGGYAALVAAARTPQIYQCAIAGAPVSDPSMQFNYYRNQLRPFDLAFEQQRRSGISPIEEVENINVPLMFIHGRVDQRVPYEHKQVYERAVSRAGKDNMVEFVTLDGADHFYNTLFFEHQIKLYENMIRFLEEDCGPGGL